MKKKSIFIIVGIIVVIALIAIGITIYLVDKSKYDFEIAKVTQIDYHVLHEDNQYGVINRNGEIVVKPEYDIIQIPNPSKDIFICMHDYHAEEKEYETDVLNSKREKIYQEYDNVQAIPTETTYDGIPFEKMTLKYKKDGKYGLLSIDGKELTKPVYEEISAISYKEGMLLVKKDEQCGVVNIKGQIVIPVEYETITADNYYNDETLYKTTGFIVSKKSDEGYRYGYINYKGHVIVKPEYTQIDRIIEIQDDKNVYLVAYKEGQAGLLKNKKVILNYEYEDINYNSYNDVFVIKRNGKEGVTDLKGNVKIPPEYESIVFGGVYINAEKDGELMVLDLDGNVIDNQDIVTKMPTKDGKNYIVADKNEMYDIINENDESIIENSYAYMEEIDNNYFVVGNNNKNGIIDLSGKAVVDLKYNSIFQIDGTDLLQANISPTNTVSLIDKKTMKVLIALDKASVEIDENYIRIYSEKENHYFSDDGKELTNKELFPNHELYAKEINGKWGFVDKNGELKVQNEYDMVTEFNEYGFAGIKKGGKWGVINSKGEIIQKPIYKISWLSPKFIGKYYQSEEWNGDLYYTNKVEKEG